HRRRALVRRLDGTYRVRVPVGLRRCPRGLSVHQDGLVLTHPGRRGADHDLLPFIHLRGHRHGDHGDSHPHQPAAAPHAKPSDRDGLAPQGSTKSGTPAASNSLPNTINARSGRSVMRPSTPMPTRACMTSASLIVQTCTSTPRAWADSTKCGVTIRMPERSTGTW